MAKVLKPFRYSVNGVDTEHLVPGDERDFGRFTAGLESEGFIAKEGKAPTREVTVDEAREVAADAVVPESVDEKTADEKPKTRTRK